MVKKYARERQLATTAFLCALLICFVNCGADEVANFDNDLRAIRHAKRKGDTELVKLETRCLSLIEDHNSPVQKGKIYSTIALMYSDRGYRPDTDPNIPTKVIAYSMKALEYPLDPLTACYMYARGSDGMIAQARRDPRKQFAEVRAKAIDLCLKGLKLAVDSNAPREYPKSPGPVARVSVAPGSALYERLMEEHKHQMEASEKWLYDTEFYWLRRGLFDRCVSLYSREPYDRETFKKKANEILKEHGDVVGELMAALDAQIEKLKAASVTRRKEPPQEPAKSPPTKPTQR